MFILFILFIVVGVVMVGKSAPGSVLSDRINGISHMQTLVSHLSRH